MENREYRTSDFELLNFDPIVIVHDVLKRWLVILMISVMMGVGAFVMTTLSYRPVYSTNTTFVVSTRTSSSTVYNNLSATTALAAVFSEIMNSSVLRSTVLADAGLESFNGTIAATSIENTNLLTLRVSGDDPRTVFLVTKAIVNNHETLTYEVVGDIALEVLQSPVVPTTPSNPLNAGHQMRRVMILTAAVVCALLAYLSLTRDAVRSSKEAQNKLNCRYLGEIEHEKKYKTLRSWLKHQKTGIVISNPITSFRFTETIRKIRHRVERHMEGRKVLMVTSLLENEGKSTVAANLALSTAKKYKRVLFLECDLRKPAGCTILEKKWTGPGVRDVLIGKAEPEDAVIQDKATGLYMLLEPKGVRNSADLAGSAAMKRLIGWARENFDFVVMDLPPVAAAMDAESIMEFADASLLVVRQNAARTSALNKAITTLSSGKAKLLGCVLNDSYTTIFSAGRGFDGYGKYGRFGKYGKYGQYGHYGPKDPYDTSGPKNPG